MDAETLKQKQIAEMKNEGMEKFCARLGFSQPNAAKEIAAGMIQVRVKKVHNVPSLKKILTSTHVITRVQVFA